MAKRVKAGSSGSFARHARASADEASASGRHTRDADDISSYRRTNVAYSATARKRGPWRMVFWVALVVLVAALAALAHIGYSYWSGQHVYDDITESAFAMPDEEDAALADFSIDWDALREINEDIVGWIYIPDTQVNYPIVHKDGDSSYYLKHNFANSSAGQFGAEYGCIMLAGENTADFSDDVNVIYGHNMRNGSMFALLSKFYRQETFDQYRTIYLFTPEGSYKLTTFALDRVLGSSTDIVIPNFETADELAAYVQQRIDDSVVTPAEGFPEASQVSQVFALSTCDGSNNTYRYITFCRVTEYLSVESSDSEDDAAAVDADVADSVEDAVEERTS